MLDSLERRGRSRLCHDCEKILGKERSRGKRHTLHTSSFPLRVPLDVRVCKVCWLLVLVVVVGEHLHSTAIVSDASFRWVGALVNGEKGNSGTTPIPRR